MKKCQLQGCQVAVFFCMAITEAKTTPVKKVINSKSSLSCRLCEVSFVANGGCYSQFSDNAKNWSGREYVCWAACSVQQKCYWRIEKYKFTLKELTTLKNRFPKTRDLNSSLWHSIRAFSGQTTIINIGRLG